MGFITGLGFTVTVKDNVPVQLFTVSVTVTVAIMGLLVILVAVYAGILPLPDVPKPTFAVLVHEYAITPPVVGLLNGIAAPGAL